MSQRTIQYAYRDPLEVVWVGLLNELGYRLERSAEVFAAFDGQGTLTLCHGEHFDPDDSLAQMIFHELCHALVAGSAGLRAKDWGMQNDDERDLLLEQACHRLQATLAAEYGLRGFFGVTTDHRPYWDSLGSDPLRSTHPEDEPSIERARLGYQRATQGPWSEPLRRALTATKQIADAARAFADNNSLWKQTKALHALGVAVHGDPTLTCGACTWLWEAQCTRSAVRGDQPVLSPQAADAACERFEPRFADEECAACGACCREGFHRVELSAADSFAKRHLELVEQEGDVLFVPRPGGRCVALEVTDVGYRCRHYAERPTACADFELRGPACLEARRRVGLSD
ncbi:MAG: YkgJ family cysteine cluster protein [Polyangiaceae bacterium]|nr:YkgJ family cysteine cluster protein [Myxococcales bacterium]MCB9590287.1 YkgJ family cysteine cluster protein [Polyangiaceae bacterium]MCB9605058.1 YkgJ family cysteine cluster protein [Polyangiaceae bacterium]